MKKQHTTIVSILSCFFSDEVAWKVYLLLIISSKFDQIMQNDVGSKKLGFYNLLHIHSDLVQNS